MTENVCSCPCHNERWMCEECCDGTAGAQLNALRTGLQELEQEMIDMGPFSTPSEVKSWADRLASLLEGK